MNKVSARKELGVNGDPVVLHTRKMTFDEIEHLLQPDKINAKTVKEATQKLLKDERSACEEKIKAEFGIDANLFKHGARMFRECFPHLTYYYGGKECSKEEFSEFIKKHNDEKKSPMKCEYKINVEFGPKIRSYLNEGE